MNKEFEIQKIKASILGLTDEIDLTMKQDEECVAKQNVLKSSYEEKLAALKSLQKDLDK